MNFRKTAIALAIVGIAATPMAAQADLYASARIGLINVDTDGGLNNWDLQGLGSRFGVKSETDLGNGLTGFGRYEWSVNVDDSTTFAAGLRHGYVGLKGDFGKLLLGRTYQTFYNFVVGPADNPWWGSGYAQVLYRGRTSNAISYSGSAGDIGYGATFYVTGGDAAEDIVDGTEFGASFGFGGMTLGVGIQDSETQLDAVTGVLLSGIDIGIGSLAVGIQSDSVEDSILLDAGLGDAYVHFETVSAGTADLSMLTLGYTLGLGSNTTAWFEFQSNDKDGTAADSTVIRAILKYDIE